MNPPTSISPSLERITPLFPQLEIHRLVGVGELSAVFLGVQKALDRKVALKILPEALSNDEAIVERFGAAARAMAPLVHPNLTRVYDFGESGGLLWMIQEWSSGSTLREMLADGPMPLGEIGHLLTEICRGLEHAHEHGTIHGDLRASNVMIDGSGQVKLMDLGFGRIARGSGGRHALAVVAPELLEEDAVVDLRADIFSLGLMLYEMLVGERPLGEVEPPSVLRPELDAGFDTIVGTCLEPDPANRFPDCAALRREVERLVDEATSPRPQALAPPRPVAAIGSVGGACQQPALNGAAGSGGLKWGWIAGLGVLAVAATWAIVAKMRSDDPGDIARVDEPGRESLQHDRSVGEAAAAAGVADTGSTPAPPEPDDDDGAAVAAEEAPVGESASAENPMADAEDAATGEETNEAPGTETVASEDPGAADPARQIEVPPLAPELEAFVPDIPELEQLRSQLRNNALEVVEGVIARLAATKRDYLGRCADLRKNAAVDEIDFWEAEADAIELLGRPPMELPIGCPSETPKLRAYWWDAFRREAGQLERFREIYQKQVGKIRDRHVRDGDELAVEVLDLELEAAVEPDYFLSLCTGAHEQCGLLLGGNVGHASKGAAGSGTSEPRRINDGVSNLCSGRQGKPIQLELGGLLRLSAVRFELNGDKNLPERFFRYYVRVSPDGEYWETVCNRSDSGEWRGWQQVRFRPRPVRFIQIIGTHNSAVHGWFSIRELEAYCASEES